MEFEEYVLNNFKGGNMYTFVGGGGKTTSIRSVEELLTAHGYRVFFTTTTKVGMEQFSCYGQKEVKSEEAFDVFWEKVRKTDLSGVFIYHFQLEEKKKLAGVPKSWLEGLEIPLDVVLLVEGDGSRGIPLKKPRRNDPVIPDSCSQVILLAGSGDFGKRASEETLFNIEEVSWADNQLIDAPFVERLILEEWTKVLEAFPVKVWINQSEEPSKQEVGSEIIKNLWEGKRIPGIVLSLHERAIYDLQGDFIETIILAAGKSSRMGEVKGLLPLGKYSFLEHLISTYGAYSQKVVVAVGYHREAIEEAIEPLSFVYFESENYAGGMGETLKEAFMKEGMGDYVLVTHSDLPLIRRSTVYRLIEVARENRDKIIVPTYHGQKGHPVVFPIQFKESLVSLRGDEGARKLLHTENAIMLEVEDQGVIRDIDTPESYEKIVEELNDQSIN